MPDNQSKMKETEIISDDKGLNVPAQCKEEILTLGREIVATLNHVGSQQVETDSAHASATLAVATRGSAIKLANCIKGR